MALLSRKQLPVCVWLAPREYKTRTAESPAVRSQARFVALRKQQDQQAKERHSRWIRSSLERLRALMPAHDFHRAIDGLPMLEINIAVKDLRRLASIKSISRVFDCGQQKGQALLTLQSGPTYGFSPADRFIGQMQLDTITDFHGTGRHWYRWSRAGRHSILCWPVGSHQTLRVNISWESDAASGTCSTSYSNQQLDMDLHLYRLSDLAPADDKPTEAPLASSTTWDNTTETLQWTNYGSLATVCRCTITATTTLSAKAAHSQSKPKPSLHGLHAILNNECSS